MKITVDPNTDASGFGYVEAGKYTLRVVKVEEKEGPAGPYLNWSFELTDPNVKTADGKGKPGNIFEITTLKVGAQFRLRQLTDALGVEWGDFDTDNVIGSEFDAQVDIREYQGTLSNCIKKYIPVK